MRALIAIAFVAGCFNPKTNGHCQYQCAASGAPCPSGLSCVAGMCVAPGETCGGGDDGGIDMADTRTAACGDGFHDPGEICYGTPMSILGSDVTYDGQLADIDGDGDLDVVYLIGDQYVYHPFDNGAFTAARNGPTVFASHMLATNLDGDAHAELINAQTSIELWNFDLAAIGLYTRTGVQTFTAPHVAVDLAIGFVSGTRPNPIALQDGEITIYNIDGAGAMYYFYGQASITGAESVAAGKLDADTLDDVVIARMTGISFHRATGTGLAAEIPLPITGAVQGVAIGDVNNDMQNDVVFVQQTGSNSGKLGVMRAQGAGAFANPTTTTDIPSLTKQIEAAKIDGDQLADVVALKLNANAVVIALGKSDGTLAAPVEIPIAVPAVYLHADADFNGDGIVDIVVTDPNSQTILVLPSNP